MFFPVYMDKYLVYMSIFLEKTYLEIAFEGEDSRVLTEDEIRRVA